MEELTGGQKPHIIVSSMHRCSTQMKLDSSNASMLDIGVDSVSSLALLIIVVEYFVHAIQWKYFFSDANNACQVENGPQPQRGGRSPRKAFGSMGLP